MKTKDVKKIILKWRCKDYDIDDIYISRKGALYRTKIDMDKLRKRFKS